MFAFASHLIVAQEATDGGSALGFLIPLLILGGLFYVLLILPQRRRQKKMRQMQLDIEIGDEVRTIGGIIGIVVDEEGDIYTIDIGGQNLRVIKRAIAGKIEDDEDDES